MTKTNLIIIETKRYRFTGTSILLLAIFGSIVMLTIVATSYAGVTMFERALSNRAADVSARAWVALALFEGLVIGVTLVWTVAFLNAHKKPLVNNEKE